MGAEAGFLGTVFTFETDESAKQSGNENAQNKFVFHS